MNKTKRLKIILKRRFFHSFVELKKVTQTVMSFLNLNHFAFTLRLFFNMNQVAFILPFLLLVFSFSAFGYIPPPPGATPVDCSDHGVIEQFHVIQTSFPYIHIEAWACSGNEYEQYSFDVRSIQGIQLRSSEYDRSSSVQIDGWHNFTFKEIVEASRFVLEIENMATTMIKEHKYEPLVETRILNFIGGFANVMFPVVLALAFARCLLFV